MQNAAKITQIHVVAVRAVPNTNESRARKVSSTGFELNSERRMNEWTFLVCDERCAPFPYGKDLLLENVQRQVAGSPPPRSALEQEPEPGNAGRGLNRPPVV